MHYCGNDCILKKYTNRDAIIHGETEESKHAYLLREENALLLTVSSNNREEIK